MDHLISIIESANRASIRVAEKNGMRLETEATLCERRVQIYAVCRADVNL